jgi:hypothetical protein
MPGECIAGAGADTITLPSGTYTLIIQVADEDAGATGDLDVTDDLTINGSGAGMTIIEACSGASCTGVDRVFHVLGGTVSIAGVTIRNGDAANASPFLGSGGGIFSAAGSAVTLTDSTVSGNSATGGGGGIRNAGTMTVTDSTVSGNSAIAGSSAGGISNNGTLTLTDSTVSGNMAPTTGGITNLGTLMLTESTVSGNTATNFGGAGIFNTGTGTATITRSTISGNTAVGSGGGGIVNVGTLSLANSTVSGNSSNLDGGGIYNFDVGTTTITNSTISNNTANLDSDGVGDGGGISRSAGTVNLKDTILAGNHDLGAGSVEPDCFGELTSQGNNLIQTVSAGCSVTGNTATNVTGQSANLGPLAPNGPGTTETHAILSGSPAIDFASADCPPPATDQRGEARPQGNRCDIGAYESSFSGPTPQPTPSPTPSPSPSPTPTPTQSPSPTPTATPTGDPTPTPSTTGTLTPTPTGGASPTPSPTGEATPTPTPTPTGNGQQVAWGDHNCSDAVDSVDALLTLRFDAGLPAETNDCPEMGDDVDVADASTHIWGDLDCSGVANSIDALKVLRHDAGLSVERPPACPDPGENVTVTGL